MGLGAGGREVAASRVRRTDLFPATKKKKTKKAGNKLMWASNLIFLDVIY